MTFGAIGAITEAIMDGPEGGDYASMSIAGVSPVTTEVMLPERTFQYWPESISDTIDVGWNFKDIPGASHALAQWSSNGGRTISFEVHFHRFMKPKEVTNSNFFERANDPFGLTTPEQSVPIDQRPHNVDIASEIKYLRAMCYPSYGDVEGYVTSYPPPIGILNVPNLGWGDENGTNALYVVMTGCDVTYNLLFRDGTPRKATVALTLRQVVQDPILKTIEMPGHQAAFDYESSIIKSREGGTGLPEGGNRPKNNLNGWGGGPV